MTRKQTKKANKPIKATKKAKAIKKLFLKAGVNIPSNWL